MKPHELPEAAQRKAEARIAGLESALRETLDALGAVSVDPCAREACWCLPHQWGHGHRAVCQQARKAEATARAALAPPKENANEG